MHIISGDDTDFDALVYGQPHPNTLRFIEQNIRNVTQATSGVAREFFERSAQAFEYFHGHDAIRRARAVLTQVSAVFSPDIIMELKTVAQFQAAQSRMRRYIMADIEIRTMFNDQRIEGYDKRYFNMEPDSIGDTHRDYQRMNHGLVEVDEHGEAYYTLYYDFDEDEDEPELMHEEQLDIKASILRAKRIIAMGKDDPTSIWGALL